MIPRLLEILSIAAAGGAVGIAVIAMGNRNTSAILISLGLLICLGITLLITRRTTGRTVTPVTAFFAFASVHAVLGYLSSEPTTVYLIRPRGSIYGIFEKAYFIISGGLILMMISYVASLIMARGWDWSGLWNRTRDMNFESAAFRSRILALVALPVLIFVFSGFGEVPALTRDLGKERYLYLFLPEFKLHAFAYNRCRDIFQLAVPCLIIGMLARRRASMDLLIVAACLIGALAIAQRGPILSMAFTIAIVTLRGRQLSTIIWVMPLLLVAYLGTQSFLFSSIGALNLSDAIELYGNALPEVRDLSWLLSSSSDQFLWGATFLQGIIPLPGFAVDSHHAISLRTVTLDAIGFPLDSPHGGLRITFAGECYVNFGFIGVLAGSLLYGIGCAAFARGFAKLHDHQGATSFNFALSTLWLLYSFWFYLGGTAAAGMIKFQLALLAVVCWPRTWVSDQTKVVQQRAA